VTGTIIEDRGAIGFKGRRLFAIRFKLDRRAELTVEIPAEDSGSVAPRPDDERLFKVEWRRRGAGDDGAEAAELANPAPPSQID